MTKSWSFPKIHEGIQSFFEGLLDESQIEQSTFDEIKRLETSTVNFAIACSGGADSTFLVYLILTIFPELKQKIFLYHYNHNLRGKESDKDQRFVEALGRNLNVKVFCEKRAAIHLQDENSLRNDRIDFFVRQSSLTNTACILLGHHGDDVAETMLWRLTRASSVEGIICPRPISSNKNIIFLRPLINLSHSKITESLSELSIPWREDKSNKNFRYLRNRLRNDVVPKWKKSMEIDLIKGISKTRRLLQQDSDALTFYSDIEAKKCIIDGKIILENFNSCPIAVRRRVLRKWINSIQPDGFSFEGQEDSLIGQIEKGIIQTQDLPGDIRLKTQHGRLIASSRIIKDYKLNNLSFPIGYTLYLPTNNFLRTGIISIDDCLKEKIASKQIDQKKEAFLVHDGMQLLVRTKIEGDHYKPLGSSGEKKLSKMMSDAKWTDDHKRYTPVVTNLNGEILWVPGLPPAESYKVTKLTRRVIHLTYH